MREGSKGFAISKQRVCSKQLYYGQVLIKAMDFL